MTIDFRILFVVLGLVYTPLFAEESKCQLKVSISGIDIKEGRQICLTFFSSEDGFPTEPDKAVAKSCQKVATETQEFVVPLAFGDYAISVLHDANTNGSMDTNFFGIPKEGVGASNNAKGSFGPPSFKDATFKVSQTCGMHSIKVAYL